MTTNGVIHKTGLLFLGMAAVTLWIWNRFYTQGPDAFRTPMIAGGLGAVSIALVTIFKKKWAKFTAPLFALFQGMFVGGVSTFLESRLPGIPLQVVAHSFVILLFVLVAHRSGLFAPTQEVEIWMTSVGGSVTLLLAVTVASRYFGVSFFGYPNSGWAAVGISCLIAGITAYGLLVDFDFVDLGSTNSAPKQLEWLAALGLIVTLVWTYVRVARLISQATVLTRPYRSFTN